MARVTPLTAGLVEESAPARAVGPIGAREYLTPAQVAEMLQVSEKTLQRWAKADPTFPLLKLGGTVRYPRERLIRWLRDREQGRRR